MAAGGRGQNGSPPPASFEPTPSPPTQWVDNQSTQPHVEASQKVNKCVHLEVSSGILTQPLSPPPPGWGPRFWLGRVCWGVGQNLPGILPWAHCHSTPVPPSLSPLRRPQGALVPLRLTKPHGGGTQKHFFGSKLNKIKRFVIFDPTKEGATPTHSKKLRVWGRWGAGVLRGSKPKTH